MISNLSITDLINGLSPELINRIDSLVLLLQAAGIILIGYLVFLVVKGILGIIRGRKIDKIYKKVYEIERKLDKVLEGRKYKKENSKGIYKKSKKIGHKK